ncbi:ABC transporter ATP-binding protein [Paracraurococcus ruber]|uniref:Branched-chain amino acid ABC transporter ATP-binding protein n=1 Tax=Paracraurococcus ruber TaxID=77675 RepID=A0ABS1D528_9PROT|nr:ABC transporter ATP-binding protein [Paracraurococcus ruber]MBK1661798.1 branched-chain amino acid ABC transporter ATP-binding protein [Paracraurococcus ruber]TDG31068.1 ABC transporter ATP-binding protein [Paracraurococcus ruber]
MSAPLLQAEGIRVSYGRIEAVRGVDLHVGAGEFVGVIGSNGAGKSSLMRAIAGVLSPAGGRVAFGGEDTTGQPSHRMVARGLAMVPEGRMIFADQTVRENLLLGGYSRLRSDPQGVAADEDRMLTLFPRLKERLAQEAGTLSGGEQQMLAIARGLLSRPRLLVIDELSLGLAPVILDMLFPVLAQLNKEGLSILLVEQMASYALSVTDRTYVMENGRMLFDGASRELANDPRVLDAYLGRRKAA